MAKLRNLLRTYSTNVFASSYARIACRLFNDRKPNKLGIFNAFNSLMSFPFEIS